ncbi:hypothetical protein [Natrinema sp. SYSU A 869]|uniref:hypothetical protein n=1 Tax=Natrinema sp. SYSU A 869 TaxID=2871694 RepID=UPI0021030EAA|nr:hypothetical protein [Natrinema sp. SYSU A 869]
MREQQTQQSTEMNTEQMAESTMNQSQQTMEQLIDLQRNVARMTLSALKWQETAQQQGLEMTKSMLESVPGPQFTESMMQSYLQGMEAIMPEMEQVMERGMQAAAQPQMAQMEQMGNQMTGQGRMTEQGMSQQGMGQRGTSGRMDSQQMGGQQAGSQRMGSPMHSQQGMSQQGMTGQRTGHQQTGGGMRAQQGMDRQPQMQTQAQMGGQQGSSGRSQSQQYPQTGEWVTPQEYGGESTAASGSRQEPMTAAPGHSSGTESEQFGGQAQGGGPGRSQRGFEGGPASGQGQFEQGRQGDDSPNHRGHSHELGHNRALDSTAVSPEAVTRLGAGGSTSSRRSASSHPRDGPNRAACETSTHNGSTPTVAREESGDNNDAANSRPRAADTIRSRKRTLAAIRTAMK